MCVPSLVQGFYDKIWNQGEVVGIGSTLRRIRVPRFVARILRANFKEN
jgi:hypothetical protein